jgi:hypothetical protein
MQDMVRTPPQRGGVLQTLHTQRLGVWSVNKNGCYPKTPNCLKRMASLCEGIPCAWLKAIYTPRIKEGPSSGNKGCTPENRGKKPPMKTPEPIKNEPGSKQKHLWLIQSWCLTMIAGPLIGLFKMNPHQHLRSRHSQRRTKTT